MTSDGNSCFWWCLTILMNRNNPIYLKLKDLRYTTKLNQMAQGLCEDCGFDYTKKAKVESIPSIIKQIGCIDYFNIAILDIDHLPAFCSTNDMNPNIIYQSNLKTETCYYILLDKNHFSPITYIKKFLNVKSFCCKCQNSVVNPTSLTMTVMKHMSMKL